MKKTIFALVLIFSACAVFAGSVTISDWYNRYDGYYYYDETGDEMVPYQSGSVSDYGSSGLSFVSPDPYVFPNGESVNMGQYVMTFMSDKVSGWLYNSNETFLVKTVFDTAVRDVMRIKVAGSDYYIPDDPEFSSTEKLLLEAVLMAGDWTVDPEDGYEYLDNETTAYYRTEWTGNGTYTFTPEDLDAYDSWLVSDLADGAEIRGIAVSIRTLNKESYGTWTQDTRMPAGGRGTIEVSKTAEVPEPATYAYAVMGLVSAFGLKRRVRK